MSTIPPNKDRKNEIIILHFRSTMDYPPVYNLVRYLAGKDCMVHLLAGRRKESAAKLKELGVLLTEFEMEKGSGVSNYLAYLKFYISCFIKLIRTRDIPICYFESITSAPVFLYFLVFPFSKRKLSIHYHEYFDQEDLKKQSFLERLGRKLERSLFKKAQWISQTNKDRLSFFEKEFPAIDKSVLKVMPNYPPGSWLTQPTTIKDVPSEKIRLVYVGALSLDTMYIYELVEWICSKNGRIECDFYSKNEKQEVISYLNSKPNTWIRYKGSLLYDEVPENLSQYDVGLILYKAYSTNVVYSISNKLFEYLACGLDVWFSKEAVSTYEYETSGVYPKIVRVDFPRMDEFDYESAISRTGLKYRQSPYVMELVYQEFFNSVISPQY